MGRYHKFEEGVEHPLFSRIGRRIILIMILLSGAITLLTTLMQLYWDYNQEFDDVEQRHYEVENVHASLLASSLWNFDLILLQQRLDGLVNLPKIDYLEIRSGRYTFSAGEKVQDNAVSNLYPLFHQAADASEPEEIGEIYVESNAQAIYSYLLKQFFITLLLNALKTALVCYLILMVFHQSVNRRIFEVAKYLRFFNPRHPKGPLQLPYNKWIMEQDDELNWLADETNKITQNVTTLYDNIKQEQERLADFAHTASDWLWETDAQGRLIYCSDPMQEAFSIDTQTKPNVKDIPEFSQLNNLPVQLALKQDFSMCEESFTMAGTHYHVMFQAKARYEKQDFVGYRGSAINITALKNAQHELEFLNRNLEQTVANRTHDLEQSMKQLQAAQDQLIQSEKLAALGGLVAGVAHEVNTPLGISVTAASVIKDVTQELNSLFENGTLTSNQFSDLMEQISEGTSMLESNLSRAAQLIKDFKQTAVDQVSESRSQFNVKQVLEALIASLHPETRKVPVVPALDGSSSIHMNSLPGVLTQIVSNLIMNSINHAFSTQEQPEIAIAFEDDDDWVIFHYQDNGSGVDKALHQKIFEPFFTSKRGKGGSGLGLNLVYNLVNQKLKGELEFESKLNQGVHFTLRIPKDLPLSDAEQGDTDYHI
ncbi:PAS domain-containing sensor histidine kinase [Vibrio paucivorans]|uniref:histidine kinase n=1 Tax=Vibrio paucivorans TaxID=2829489 RepID=A0A9X3HTC3_9VIBR|nr:ATP-binding protein [Vibrio paucivorans]MCW8335007.1 ATP-binding protein [Vibrio paucivorans]